MIEAGLPAWGMGHGPQASVASAMGGRRIQALDPAVPSRHRLSKPFLLLILFKKKKTLYTVEEI